MTLNADTIAVLTVSVACVAFAIWSIVHKGPLVAPRKRDDD